MFGNGFWEIWPLLRSSHPGLTCLPRPGPELTRHTKRGLVTELWAQKWFSVRWTLPEKPGSRKEREEKLFSLFLLNGLFVSVVAFWRWLLDWFPCDAVVILLTHELGPCVCFSSFIVSLIFPLILVPGTLPVPPPIKCCMSLVSRTVFQ